MVESFDDNSCLQIAGANDPYPLASYFAVLGSLFVVHLPAELVQQVRGLGERLIAAGRDLEGRARGPVARSVSGSVSGSGLAVSDRLVRP